MFDLSNTDHTTARATEQKLYFCVSALLVFYQKFGTHTPNTPNAEDMSGCVSLSLWVLMCVLFLRSVWTVSHSCQTHPRMSGRPGSHSLNQPPVACACVDACLCVSMWKWVVDALFIATAIPLCH